MKIDDYRVYRLTSDEFGKPVREQVAYYNLHAASRAFTLAAGDYIAAAGYRGKRAERQVSVTPGKGVEIELVLQEPGTEE